MSHFNSELSNAVIDQLNKECAAMIKYALSSQLNLSPELSKEYIEIQEGDITKESVARLTKIHVDLTKLVSPANPGTILLLEEESKKKSAFKVFGAVSLVRKMMATAIICLVGLFLISLHSEVNGNESNFSLLDNSGVKLLINEIFLLFAAGIGASFAALYNAQKYIKNMTYDPIYESNYIVLFVLGLISGTLLASLIPIEAILGGEGNENPLKGFGKPILAILGGFSSSLVYEILNRLKSTLNTLISGDKSSQNKAETLLAKSRQKELDLDKKNQVNEKVEVLKKEISSLDDKDEMVRRLEAFRAEISAG